MEFKHIVFDLDGTLSDPTEGIRNSFRYLFNEMKIDIDIDSRFSELVGPPLHAIFTNVLGWTEDQAEEGVRVFREYYGEKGVFENRVYPGIPDLLKELQNKGKKLYVATSKYETFARKVLDYHAIGNCFEKVAGASYRGVGAGKTEILQNVLNTIPKSEVQKTVMVGDRKFDIEAANALKIKSIGVLYGFGSETELQETGANLIVDNVSKLESILKKS